MIPQDSFIKKQSYTPVAVEKGHDILKHVEPGDFVISMRSFQGGLEYCRIRGKMSSAYIALEVIDERVNPEYFKWLLKSERYISMLQSTTNLVRDGQALRFANIIQGNLPLPPYEEQAGIASFLDEKCAEIDKAIEAAEVSIEEYKLYKKSVIFQAVTKGLDPDAPMKDSGIEWIGEIPANWNVARAKEWFELTSSKGNSELVLLAATQKNGMYPQSRLEGVVRVSEDADLTTFKTVHKGDFVISLRSFQGGFERSDFEGVCSPAYQTFRSIKDICSQFFKYLFKSHGFIEEMNSLTLGIREGKTIKYSDFSNSFLAIPPIKEQEDISGFLDQKCSEIDKLIEAKQQIIEELKAYKKSLIWEAVTGKREVPCL
ncbi:MAG: restriction endonuclease subunit S [Atopobiaceae bacterium]|jgi:type I restriction enzyme S subunit